MSSIGTCGRAVLLGALLGCTPDYDWREVRPEGAGVSALFPCRPQHHMRAMDTPQVTSPMHLQVCSRSGSTFAVGWLDVAEPARVESVLDFLRAAAKSNMAASESAMKPFAVPGMTPNQGAAIVSLRGRTPGGAPLNSQIGFFAKGLRVYQATVFGAELDVDASDMFFAGLKLP